MQERALEMASHITHPVTVAAFALVFAALAFGSALKLKKTGIAWILAVAIILLGLGPLCASTFLRSRGIYRIRLMVLGTDGNPVQDAHVNASTAGEANRTESGWEFDVPPQSRPEDGKVTLYASVKNAFLRGNTSVVLAEDYYPTATIQLRSDASAVLRGVVVDERRRSVVGAQVSVVGYPDVALTDPMGNFVLPAHAAEGQMVEVRAAKGEMIGSVSAPAGRALELVVKNP